MENQDLFLKSPVRLFEKNAEKLENSQIVLITAKKGLGKTSVLVQFGMDVLLRGENLVHVTFDLHSSNVISWYDSIFAEIAKKSCVQNPTELKESVMRHRTIMNFSLDSFSLEKVVATLNSLKSAGFPARGVVMDGIDFSKVSEADFNAVQKYVLQEQSIVLMSATSQAETLDDVVSKSNEAIFSTVLNLRQSQVGVCLDVLKCNGKKFEKSALKLDTRTLLISEK